MKRFIDAIRKLFTKEVDRKVDHIIDNQIIKPLQNTAKSGNTLERNIKKNNFHIVFVKAAGGGVKHGS